MLPVLHLADIFWSDNSADARAQDHIVRALEEWQALPECPAEIEVDGRIAVIAHPGHNLLVPRLKGREVHMLPLALAPARQQTLL